MSDTPKSMSDLAKKVLIYLYIQEVGIPDWAGDDPASAQMKIFSRLTGASEQDTAAAFAEVQDMKMVDRDE